MLVNVVLPNGGSSQSFDFAPFAHGPRGSYVVTATAGVYQIDASVIDLGKVLAMGFVIAPLVCTTANRPNSPYVGQEVFDTTLGTPVWRSAVGTWVSATGATV